MRRSGIDVFVYLLLAMSLIASLVSVQTVLALNSFSDGFESGDFSAWTAAAARRVGDSCRIEDHIVFKGQHSGKFQTLGNAVSTEYADCYVNVNNSNLVYARGYYYFGSDVLPLEDNGDRFTMIQWGWTGGDRSGSAQVERVSGTPQWAVRVYVGETAVTYRSAAPTPAEEFWWEIQLMEKVDAAAGEVHLWVNGSEVISKTGLNTTKQGQINRVHFGSPYAVNVQHNMTIYADCCKVSDSYIQPERQGPDPSGCTISLPAAPVTMQVSNGSVSYFKTLLSNVPSGYDVTNGVYLGWCVDIRYTIARSPSTHSVTLYPSCNPPVGLKNERWDMVNYILNHKQGVMIDIQQAISYFIKMNGQAQGWRSGYTPTVAAKAMVDDALAHGSGYIPVPSPTEVLAVICYPEEATQITIIEVPPPPPAVGGEWVPMSKLQLLSPWITLEASLMAVTAVSFVCVGHRRKRDNS